MLGSTQVGEFYDRVGLIPLTLRWRSEILIWVKYGVSYHQGIKSGHLPAMLSAKL